MRKKIIKFLDSLQFIIPILIGVIILVANIIFGYFMLLKIVWLNTLIFILISWIINFMLFKLFFLKRIITFQKICKILNKRKLIGFSSKDNVSILNINRNKYKVWKNEIQNLKSWEFPIVKYCFKNSWIINNVPQIIYCQETIKSKSRTKFSQFNRKDSGLFEINLHYCNKWYNRNYSRNGSVSLSLDLKNNEIVFFGYSNVSEENSFSGILIFFN